MNRNTARTAPTVRIARTKRTKRVKRTALLGGLLALTSVSAGAYTLTYAEQLYRLYHLHLNQYPDDTIENIVWLEAALKADFANPLNALAPIETPQEWSRYRNLFRMHLNLELAELHLTLGSKYDKRRAYFYNAPWRDANLDSLDKAESAFRAAFYYWDEALYWSDQTLATPGMLEEIQNWEDRHARIQRGLFDYGEIIQEQLDRLEGVREQFQLMDENTY